MQTYPIHSIPMPRVRFSIQHQQTFAVSDTIQAKLRFEKAAYDDGVIVQDFHTDNGVFTSHEILMSY